MKSKTPLPGLSNREIEWLARMLLLMAEVPADRRVSLVALACKVGFIDREDWRYRMVREKVGLEP